MRRWDLFPRVVVSNRSQGSDGLFATVEADSIFFSKPDFIFFPEVFKFSKLC